MLFAGVVASNILFHQVRRTNEEDERTDEEYIAVLLDNKEDFDYVAEAIQHWTSVSFPSHINFYLSDNEEIVIDNRFSTNNQEIADEILNNQDLYIHLQNIYSLGEIRRIACNKSSDGYMVVFTFFKFPKDFHGGFIYMESMDYGPPIHKIDAHWGFEMLPNI